MASYSATFSGDLTSYIAGKIFDAANMAKAEKERANEEAARYGVEPDAKRGEFFGRALQSQFGGDLYNRTLGIFDPRKQHAETDRRSSREARYSAQFRYPDRLAKGQSTPFASPLPSDYYNRGQSSSISAAASARRAGQPFPNVAVGAPISSQTQPKTPAMTATTTPEAMFGGKDESVKVKDPKLGVFLAAVAESINSSISSINSKLDETEEGVIQAKEGIAGTVKQLEYNADSLESRLDAIIDVLRQQMQQAKKQTDKDEIKQKAQDIKDQSDLASTLSYTPVGGDSNQTRMQNQMQDAYEQQAQWRQQMMQNREPDAQAETGLNAKVSGPDEGYDVKLRLHGDEQVNITPIDNNYTQGQPSAMDGKVRQKPFDIAPISKLTPMLSNAASGITSDKGSSNSTEDEMENLVAAGELMPKASAIVTLGLLQQSLGDMGTLAGPVSPMLKEVGKPIADRVGVPNTITDKVVKQAESKSAEDTRRKINVQSGGRTSSMMGDNSDSSSSSSSGGKKWWKPWTWFRNDNKSNNEGGEGGPGTTYNRISGGSGGPGATYNRMGGTGGGWGLPGTGTVLKPLTTRTSAGGYETRLETQFHLLGIPLGFRERYRGDTGRSKMGSLWPLENPDSRAGVERFNRNKNRPYNLVPNYEGSNMVRPEAIPRRNVRTAPSQSSPTRTNRYGETESSDPLTNMVRGIRDAYIPESRIRAIEEAQGKPLGNTTYGEFQKGLMDQYGRSTYGEQRRQLLGPQSSSPAGQMSNNIAMLDYSSKQQALSRMGSRSSDPAPIVLNNVQSMSTQSDDVPIRPISTVGSHGLTDFYPSVV